MLNRLDTARGMPARIKYRQSDYAVIVPGSHVVCAITGKAIPLDELKYWSYARQEPYIDAEASLEAERRAGTLPTRG